MKYALGSKQPTVGKHCYIADSADVIGDVHLADGASIWFNAVIRADNATVTIGTQSNIQDGAVLHVDEGYPLTIGDNVTVGHNAMLHGCTIGDGSLIGINAVVLNGAKIGANCVVGAGALVTENTVIEDNQLVLGAPAKAVKSVGEGAKKMLAMGAKHYAEKSIEYTEQLRPIND